MSVLNRLLATIFALALFVGGLLTAVEVVLVQLQRPAVLVPLGQWSSWFRAQAFDAGIVRAVCAGLVLLGLLLLVVGLRRGKPSSLRLPGDTPGVEVTASRRGLERMVASAAGRVDGVSGVHVRARRRRLRVGADTRLRDPGDLQQRVTDAVRTRLADLGLERPQPKVSVRTRGAR